MDYVWIYKPIQFVWAKAKNTIQKFKSWCRHICHNMAGYDCKLMTELYLYEIVWFIPKVVNLYFSFYYIWKWKKDINSWGSQKFIHIYKTLV